jgi:hypothetical protein
MKATFDFTPWHSSITQVSGVLIAGTNERDLIPMGTAFLCAPYVALTARHVVDEIFEQFDGCLPTDATGDLSFGVQLGLRFGDSLVKWDVMAYGYSASIDIAALILEPANELPTAFEWHLPQFEVLPPTIGDQISAFGYPKSTHRLDTEGLAKIMLNPHTATGEVIEVHYLQRDSALLKFPCLHTNARFDGGMSGGPVFNAAGSICGLITSNMPPATPDEEHSSYVSLIWPALGLGLTVTPEPPREVTERYYLKQLADRGEMRVPHAACVTVSVGEGKDQLHLTPPNPADELGY